MEKNILGICILKDVKDKTEKYVEYICKELETVCSEVRTLEDTDYECVLGDMADDVKHYDYVIVTDTDAFGPVIPIRDIIKKYEDSEETFYCIPHFLILRESAAIDMNKYPYELYNLYEDIAFNGCAFIPKKAFIQDKRYVLKYNNAVDLSRCMEYVKNNSLYDVSIIYDYLIRHYNLNDIKDSLNLNYVLSENYHPSNVYNKKIAVVSHMYYEDLFDYDLRYLKSLPDNADLFLTTDSENKKKNLEKMFEPVFGKRLKVIIVEKRGRELSALLISCRDIPGRYDYFCFIHDKKSSQVGLATVGAAFRDLLWDNMLYNRNYVEQIISLFEENPWLGMLIPPNVSHGTYFGTSADYWTICYDKVTKIAKRLNLDANIDRDKPPIAIGSVFWCRSDAIAPLMQENWSYNDFPKEPLPDDGSFSHALERVFPYVAQSQGYLSGIVMTTEYARAEISNYRYMLTGTIKSMLDLPLIKLTDYDEFADTTSHAGKLIDAGEFDVGLKRTIKNFINTRTPFKIGGRR